MNFGLKSIWNSLTNPNLKNTFGLLSNSLVNDPLKTVVRFYERKRFIRRFGYRPHYHSRGLLPRLKDDVLPVTVHVPEPKPDPWRKEVAMFGQNDYIDILSGDKVNPTDTMSSIPSWLRKFKGNEMQMLIRRRKAKAHWQWSRPQKWDQLNKRIDFLYKRLNYKQAPRRPEYPKSF